MRNIDRVEERDIILKKKGDLSFGERSPMKNVYSRSILFDFFKIGIAHIVV